MVVVITNAHRKARSVVVVARACGRTIVVVPFFLVIIIVVVRIGVRLKVPPLTVECGRLLLLLWLRSVIVVVVVVGIGVGIVRIVVIAILIGIVLIMWHVLSVLECVRRRRVAVRCRVDFNLLLLVTAIRGKVIVGATDCGTHIFKFLIFIVAWWIVVAHSVGAATLSLANRLSAPNSSRFFPHLNVCSKKKDWR